MFISVFIQTPGLLTQNTQDKLNVQGYRYKNYRIIYNTKKKFRNNLHNTQKEMDKCN